MWLLPRLRLAFARRPWSYWLLVALAAGFAWWRIASLHTAAERARDSWGNTVEVWVAVDDIPRGGAVRAERRTLPDAAVPDAPLDDLAPDALAARPISAGAVVVPADVAADSATPDHWVIVAVEAQACGTPVVAAAVGGLRTAVADQVSGLLVDGHDPRDFATAITSITSQPLLRAELSRGAHMHAASFGWAATTAGLLASYSAALANTAAGMSSVAASS